MPQSDRCFAPSRGFFSRDGKCGRKTMENGLCEFHWNILYCSPAHPEKSFPYSDKCKMDGMCIRDFLRMEYANLVCPVLNLKILPSEVLLDPFIISHLILVNVTIR